MFEDKNPTKTKEMKAKANKPVENYMAIEFDYNSKTIVMPHKDGVALLAALGKAEKLMNEYSKKPVINNDKIKFETTIYTKDKYIEFKMNHLLGLNDIPNAQE